MNIATAIIAIAIRNAFIVYLQIILIRFFRQPAAGKAVVGQDRGLLTQIYVGRGPVGQPATIGFEGQAFQVYLDEPQGPLDCIKYGP